MERTVKLIAAKTFHDAQSKISIPQGVMFYTDSDRAVTLVSGGFADIIERPKPEPVKQVVIEDDKVKEVSKPAAVVKRQAARKPVKK